jgi:hypothetical protein
MHKKKIFCRATLCRGFHNPVDMFRGGGLVMGPGAARGRARNHPGSCDELLYTGY